MRNFFTLLLMFLLPSLKAQTLGPEVTSWKINTTGATGYNSIPSNVLLVRYGTANVYISANSIPSYNIGPWNGNPNTPSAQAFVWKITRTPVQNTSTAVTSPNGSIGVWSNGVSIFNARDAMSYNNGGIWNQDALVSEGASFDNCLGHPAPGGLYHNHVNPTCLYDDADSTNHSPIIGYAFDGFPVYGAYGYTNVNGTGAIKRMATSYRKRNITDRTTLANGTVLTSGQYGPSLATFALGKYVEDYEYVQGLGDLDTHNGRFCVTPDYPNGIYAYFVTINASLYPVYPYVIGPSYYGTVQAGNTGPNGGNNTPTESVTTYAVSSTIDPGQLLPQPSFGPNPTSSQIVLNLPDAYHWSDVTLRITNLQGATVSEQLLVNTSEQTVNVAGLESGLYLLRLTSASGNAWQQRLILRH
jgi:hypothetical protein